MSKFILKPLQNVTQTGNNSRWQATDLPVLMELVPEHLFIPSGWVLMQGRLHRWGSDFSARLFAEVNSSASSLITYDIPVTLKGTIFELIKLPEGVKRLYFQPMNSCGEFELRHVFLKPVGMMERFARMVRRVVPVFFKQPRARRQRVGLSIYTPLINLSKAYRLVGRFRAYSPALTYKKWIEEFDLLTSADRRAIKHDVNHWHSRPHFCIIIDSRQITTLNDSNLLLTLKFLHGQLYKQFNVLVLITPDKKTMWTSSLPAWAHPVICQNGTDWLSSISTQWLREKAARWLIVLKPGMILTEHALYWLASEAIVDHAVKLLYTDHDYLDYQEERFSPTFKPDWSPELLRSTNYIGPAVAIRADLLEQSGECSYTDIGNSCNHNLLLRISEQLEPAAIRHIPVILFHLPFAKTTAQAPDVNHNLPDPVTSHLERSGISAKVHRTPAGHFKVQYTLPSPLPLISIIIPTRNALTHLRNCIESVLTKSTYRKFELIVIDNQSDDPQALHYLAAIAEHPKVRILRFNKPFNYSAINNFAVAKAKGKVLCLLNNDTEVISADWMETMLGHLTQSRVGVVGAKLYFSDGRIQHAGDTVGPGGCAHHLHSFLHRDAKGYCNRAILAQDLSAVTAACLMTWHRLFISLGGLNAINLPIAFNDVDYCLRVREAGYRVVWTPYAELYHHESATRGKDESPEKVRRARREVAYMRKRWKHIMHHDPFYNPNLSYDRPDFSLSNAPMINKPWLK